MLGNNVTGWVFQVTQRGGELVLFAELARYEVMVANSALKPMGPLKTLGMVCTSKHLTRIVDVCDNNNKVPPSEVYPQVTDLSALRRTE